MYNRTIEHLDAAITSLQMQLSKAGELESWVILELLQKLVEVKTRTNNLIEAIAKDGKDEARRN